MRSWRSALVAVLLLTSACASGARPGVNVKSVASNLVYGVPKKVVPAAPPNFETPTEPVTVAVQGGNISDRPPDYGLGQTPLAPECAVAPPDKFPKKAAKSEVEGRPQAGQYQWRIAGKEKTNTFGTVKLFPTTQRIIKDVKANGANLDYTVRERDLHFGSSITVETTYEIRSDGIYLTKILSSSGGSTGSFAPTPAINIFPLPAGLGNKIDSTGVDPTTLEAMRITGSVPKRFRVDACGEPLDSFFVDGTETFIHGDGSTESRNYDFGMAPQLGGIIIFEHVDTPCSSQSNGKCTPDPTLTFDAHIGQAEPSPVRGSS